MTRFQQKGFAGTRAGVEGPPWEAVAVQDQQQALSPGLGLKGQKG